VNHQPSRSGLVGSNRQKARGSGRAERGGARDLIGGKLAEG
jgi:hypothetical protein